ncbi:flagellar biosynthesis protein FlhA [Agathobaculum sp. NTUH-O15-33]|nr:flagellar biosynthesis protein FlhA [Agathobaculum sp. NTUH-O15-33]WNX86691.1 flagellar biosynthesis protein FlhA [Agathobaculum sp. NTUH-O15-33]
MKLLNNFIAVFVLLIVTLLIVPLGTQVLDFMFILNLALSLIILLTTMYIKEPLEFSIFPSLLLITTLFRLGLNVSSTRSILTREGYAGEVIATFGHFVIQDNVAVGLVVFLIIVLVQFIVITKGAERVAEVSARFTLDAMPGKQMAIDADLSSGLIDEAQARERRSKIQREADFFGSMDGASKFVKGDAIISIVVTFVNLIGGLVVGLLNGQGDIGTIVSIYSTSTVGDGLMSQIPALLISVATGMIVTRSASDGDLNTDVIKQFTSQPLVLVIAGAALPLLCLIGFPVPQVLLLSALLLVGGTLLLRKSRAAVAALDQGPPVTEEVTSEVSFYKNLDNVYGLLNVDPIGVEVGYSLLPLVDQSSGGNFLDRIVMLRKQFADEMGMVIPSVRLKDSSQLNPNQYEIKLKGERVAVGEVLIDHYLALAPADGPDNIEGIETVEPAFGMPAKWISEDKKLRAEVAGYVLIDPTSVIITHLSELIRKHAWELLTRQEVKRILDNLKKTNDTIVDDTIPSSVSLNELHKVLRGLLREDIPIGDMETILETLSDYAPSVKDSDMLTEYVRQALRRTITRRFSEAGQMKVLSVDGGLENLILNNVKKLDGGAYLSLEPNTIQKIIAATTDKLTQMKKLVQTPIILTSPVVRVYFKKLLDQFYPDVTVLSFNDIDSNVQIQSLGMIEI